MFNDVQVNGVQITGETGLAGLTVFVDENGTGVLAANDPTTTTDASGNYSFSNLPVGTFSIDSCS